jgi:pimeloyl-ACP methyl ester carboxylesterase
VSSISSATDPEEIEIFIWGQSLGTTVATHALATYLQSQSEAKPSSGKDAVLRIRGLVLETAFTATKDLIDSLYPEKWLPYRYLGPFSRNRWDSVSAFSRIGPLLATSASSQPTLTGESDKAGRTAMSVLILQGGKDELVPQSHGERILQTCLEIGLSAELVVLPGALHSQVMTDRKTPVLIAGFVNQCIGMKEP